MTKTIAIIGAGSGVGMAVARKFGKEGFQVALLARSEDKLQKYVAQLAQSGIKAAAFAADVLYRPGLEKALARVKDAFGAIDVLEYSPTPDGDSTATPRNTTVDIAWYHYEFQVLGAIAAVRQVLPDMISRGDGALLFCMAASAKDPIIITASYAMGASAQRSYAYTLNKELAKDGIYAGIVGVAGMIVKEDPDHPHTKWLASLPEDDPRRRGAGMPMPDDIRLSSAQIADAFWDLYTKRDRVEHILGNMELVHQMVEKLYAGKSDG